MKSFRALCVFASVFFIACSLPSSHGPSMDVSRQDAESEILVVAGDGPASLSMRVHFPAPPARASGARAIISGSTSISIEITDLSANILAAPSVAAPSAGGTALITVSGLPVGSIRARARAAHIAGEYQSRLIESTLSEGPNLIYLPLPGTNLEGLSLSGATSLQKLPALEPGAETLIALSFAPDSISEYSVSADYSPCELSLYDAAGTQLGRASYDSGTRQISATGRAVAGSPEKWALLTELAEEDRFYLRLRNLADRERSFSLRIERAIYLAEGTPAGSGTRTNPYLTDDLASRYTALMADGIPTRFLLRAGGYPLTAALDLIPGGSLYGGFSIDGAWTRNLAADESLLTRPFTASSALIRGASGTTAENAIIDGLTLSMGSYDLGSFSINNSYVELGMVALFEAGGGSLRNSLLLGPYITGTVVSTGTYNYGMTMRAVGVFSGDVNLVNNRVHPLSHLGQANPGTTTTTFTARALFMGSGAGLFAAGNTLVGSRSMGNILNNTFIIADVRPVELSGGRGFLANNTINIYETLGMTGLPRFFSRVGLSYYGPLGETALYNNLIGLTENYHSTLQPPPSFFGQIFTSVLNESMGGMTVFRNNFLYSGLPSSNNSGNQTEQRTLWFSMGASAQWSQLYATDTVTSDATTGWVASFSIGELLGNGSAIMQGSPTAVAENANADLFIRPSDVYDYHLSAAFDPSDSTLDPRNSGYNLSEPGFTGETFLSQAQRDALLWDADGKMRGGPDGSWSMGAYEYD